MSVSSSMWPMWGLTGTGSEKEIKKFQNVQTLIQILVIIKCFHYRELSWGCVPIQIFRSYMYEKFEESSLILWRIISKNIDYSILQILLQYLCQRLPHSYFVLEVQEKKWSSDKKPQCFYYLRKSVCYQPREKSIYMVSKAA